MTQKEKVELEDFAQKLDALDVTVSRVEMYLKDDMYSSNKGLISRINDLERSNVDTKNFIRNAKWVIFSIGVPVLVYVLRGVMDGIDAFSRFMLK